MPELIVSLHVGVPSLERMLASDCLQRSHLDPFSRFDVNNPYSPLFKTRFSDFINNCRNRSRVTMQVTPHAPQSAVIVGLHTLHHNRAPCEPAPLPPPRVARPGAARSALQGEGGDADDAGEEGEEDEVDDWYE